jgi:hypothetical protein
MMSFLPCHCLDCCRAAVVAVLLSLLVPWAIPSALAEDLGELPHWPIGLGVPEDAPVLRNYADVPEDDRANWLWVADRELAEAWFRLHAVHGQKSDW